MLTLEPTAQYTFAATARFASITEESDPVVRVPDIWNIHTAPVTFSASSVTYDRASIDNIPVEEQYTPDTSTRPDRSPLVK